MASTETWKVVPFNESHLQGVLTLCEFEGWPSFPEDRQRALRALTAPGVTTVVAVDSDGAVIGFAQLLSDGEIQAYLAAIAVRPGSRRTGVGRSLLSSGLESARGLRVDLLSEETAEPFYRSLEHRLKPGYRIYPPI
jgi:ribosomal protein S18 acetylase RimI-like enzyme